MPSIQLIEKLELPLQEPVWYPTAVKSGQRISIKAIVEYLNISPANNRKAVLLVRAYNEAGEEVDVSLESMFRSDAFDAHFKYLASTQGEVEELYTFVVPKEVATIHFGFNRFLCSEEEQVIVSDLTIYPEVETELPEKPKTADNHFIEKLELPLKDPVWYPTAVKPGQGISIKAIVEYLNIDLTNSRKALLLIRSYDETGNEVDVQLDKTFKSEGFGAYFIYLPSTQSKVTDLYTFVVPEGISTIQFGFIRFLCSENEQVVVSELTIQPQAIMVSDDISAIITVHDDYQKAYEKLVKFRKNIEVETNKFLEEIKSVSELNLVANNLLHNTKGISSKRYESKRKYIDIKNNFSHISYDYGSKLWPKKAKETKFISVLDEISETSWSEEFKLFRLVKKSFVEQIEVSTASGIFIESCWKGNQGEWEYAFTSPGLKHQNAHNLLKALDLAKAKGLPILFWNKEDPMHYEKFLPIAEKCDIIFTTDSNRVDDYKKDLNNENIYCLPFAANPYICNPMNRSRYEEENICFAGSYYSVGHDDRKLQMDKMLPALLGLDGVPLWQDSCHP